MALPFWLTAPLAHRGLFSHAVAAPPEGAGADCEPSEAQTEQVVPENSLAAFEAACHAGFGIELDVQLSADGTAMVFHDATLARMTGRTGRLSRHTAAQLRQMHLLGTGEHIPTLAEVLALVNGRVGVLVEVKTSLTGPESTCRSLLPVLEAWPDTAVVSFDPRCARWLHQHAPHILRGQWAARLPAPMREPVRIPGLVDGHPHFVGAEISELHHSHPQQARELGYPLLTWTVKTAAQLQVACELADGLIFERGCGLA